jgi:hypothetical protein
LINSPLLPYYINTTILLLFLRDKNRIIYNIIKETTTKKQKVADFEESVLGNEGMK